MLRDIKPYGAVCFEHQAAIQGKDLVAQEIYDFPARAIDFKPVSVHLVGFIREVVLGPEGAEQVRFTGADDSHPTVLKRRYLFSHPE